MFYSIFVSCRSSRIAVANGYFTCLSTVQVSYLNSEKANEDLPERIYKFLNMVEEVGGPGYQLAVSVGETTGKSVCFRGSCAITSPRGRFVVGLVVVITNSFVAEGLANWIASGKCLDPVVDDN